MAILEFLGIGFRIFKDVIDKQLAVISRIYCIFTNIFRDSKPPAVDRLVQVSGSELSG